MRLIDADALLEKYNVKDVTMAECLTDTKMAKSFEKFCIISDAVEDAPTVDAVPVVRCKDCKWYRTDVGRGYCVWRNIDDDLPENFYCADGERKGGNE